MVSLIRIRKWVEGKFGEGKRFYGLGPLKTRLEKTCKAVVAMLKHEAQAPPLFLLFYKTAI